MFWVISSGRCGNHSLTAALDSHSQIECYQETMEEAIYDSLLWIQNMIPTQFFMMTFNRELEYKQISPNLGEVCTQFWPVIPFVNDTVPDSKFIWLIRDGREVVASYMKGNKFNKPREVAVLAAYGTMPDGSEVNEEPIEAPLDPEGWRMGVTSYFEWRAMTQFMRCCWYWKFVNTYISQRMHDLKEGQWIAVKLEELKGPRGKLDEITEWLGFKPEGLKFPHLDATKHPHWSTWDGELRKAFQGICGPMMDTFYPGWSWK